tara:strand:+ start:115 stop:552 length:438 start_codon:yes stop_codon:yes gene_type:complete
MSLFKNQIKTLIATMSKVKEVESFDMASWYEEDDMFDCGFAACICGFQAVTKKSKFFGNNNYDLHDHAGEIAEDLVSSCNDLMGNGFLALSIYSGCCEGRYDHAVRCREFTWEELDHPHLTKQNPTPADAISFMELVLTKLDDIK